MIGRKILVIAIVICMALLIPIQLPKEVERGEIPPTVLALEAPRAVSYTHLTLPTKRIV